MRINYRANLALLLLILISSLQSCVSNKNKSKDQPYLLVLSMDGFRWDYPEKANTPILDSLEKIGVRANLIPAFPTKTFPNHYSIATGLYPEHHGIILNNFYNYELERKYSMHDTSAMFDPQFYNGEPIWNTAEKQGITSASYFWVGSETAINHHQPHYWKRYDHFFPFTNIVDTVVYWLKLPEENRPHFITFYFNEPDETGHIYGPNSQEIISKVELLDSIVGDLIHKLNQLPISEKINFIILSDHGMEELSIDRVEYFDNYIQKEWLENYYGGNPAYLFKCKPNYLDSVYINLKKANHLSVFKPNEIPERFKLNENLNVRDLLVLADSSWTISWQKKHSKNYKGTHGFDNQNTDMHAIFYAFGPRFKQNYKAGNIENINLYELMSEILKITPEKTDGDKKNIVNMLKE